MNKFEIFKISVINGDEDKAVSFLEANYQNIGYTELMELLGEAMIEVGNKYKTGEFFIPEMLISSQLTGLLFELFCKNNPDAVNNTVIDSSMGIIFGTVQGDIHTIGKDIIVKALSCCGLNIIDIGVNVSYEKFKNSIEKHNPEIVMMSAFTTATRRNLEKIFKELKNSHPDLKIFIGGAAVNSKYADEIRADGFFENIIEIIKYLKNR
ncbi:cobalamin-dependent protein [bacterium]|nr:cobalamin-dependent protein [bacterium]